MPSASPPITFFNRHSAQIETETVYGEGPLRWVYETTLGRMALHALVRRGLFSKWYGWRMDQPASRARVACFIERYGLDAAQFAEPAESYATFNDFFYRKLKPSARPIDAAPASVVLPADGRHLLLPDVAACEDFFIKGTRFNLAALLGDAELARRFAHGTMIISRLCPVDYHRFHFPCAGTASAPRLINGPLYSVSPLALARRPSILWENKRYLTRIASHALGEVLYLEIGATCVGSVVHTSTSGEPFGKGAEKGYFAFGGSSTLTLFEPGAVRLEADLLENSARQIELYARIGSRMGHSA